MGLALAQSITGSVHELFIGTERVRQGDFTHRINIQSRDQLGELADSFNQMTGSIEKLLQRRPRRSGSKKSCASRGRCRCRCCRSGPLRVAGHRGDRAVRPGARGRRGLLRLLAARAATGLGC